MKQRIVLALFFLSLTGNVVAVLADPGWLVLPAALLGWYVADLLSGLIHMYMDYHPCPPGKRLDKLYFYPSSRGTPEYEALLGDVMRGVNPFQRLVYDFKNHHPRPLALGRRHLWRLIGSTVVLGTLPLSLALNIAALLLPVPGWVMAGFVALLIGGGFAQYFHSTLHRDDNPLVVRVMRRMRLLMTPEAHQLHHDTLQRDFATNCGWSNPLVNRVFAAARARGYFADAGLEPTA